jgi:hypothetical protein
MIKHFKFFEGPAKKQRVFTDFLDALDDYHLGGIQHATETLAPQLKVFNLNVMYSISGRIPSYTIAFESNNDDNTTQIFGTVGDFENNRLSIPWCFTSLSIRRGGETQETFSSYTVITYQNVDEMNERGLIFDSQDMLVIRYKTH